MGTNDPRAADGGRQAEPASEGPRPVFSLFLEDLHAERVERDRRSEAAAVDVARRERDQRAGDRGRFEARRLTHADRNAMLSRIQAAFENEQREVMLVSFPSEFCTDGRRKMNNRLSDWLDTLPGGAQVFVEFWRDALQPGGSGLGARILTFPGGMPGDVGIVVTWPQGRG
ncbi:hypothetical protein [Falsiroseomonas tokyonensis]|uniref:Uncharacterized protein n=1 Tax=Falsiroseomonas tokyonensis TaxID=430521 RepID=A0ABV7BVI4_9PROT|nr:hypothetical protein [Falsiroseomonas tokyonensis]MBU8538852.1 hypothetical protein [Falsiroseomonas tokyonensis]